MKQSQSNSIFSGDLTSQSLQQWLDARLVELSIDKMIGDSLWHLQMIDKYPQVFDDVKQPLPPIRPVMSVDPATIQHIVDTFQSTNVKVMWYEESHPYTVTTITRSKKVFYQSQLKWFRTLRTTATFYAKLDCDRRHFLIQNDV